MFDFSNLSVRILVGVVVIILGFLLLKFFNSDKEESITEYAAPVKPSLKGILKSPKKLIKKIESIPKEKNVSWAPSPVDTVMIPENGEWDTNRFPTSFVTNVASGGFPDNDEGVSAARPTKWTPPTPANFAIPDLTMKGELGSMPEPALGSDDLFAGELGSI